MLLLPSDACQINEAWHDDRQFLVQHSERSVEETMKYENKESLWKKRKLSVLSLMRPYIVANKKQRIADTACQIPSKVKKNVRFDLSGTTIHPLGRVCYDITWNNEHKKDSNDDQTMTKNEDNKCSVTAIVKNTLDEEDQIKESMWYSRHELQQIKRKACFVSKSVQLDSELTESYDVCCSDRTNNPTINHNNILLQRLLVASNNIKKQHNSSSSSYSNKWNDFILQRGLERWSSVGLSCQRTTNMVIWKTLFFLEQTEQFIAGCKDPIKLADICRNGSRPAIYFAQILASIDAFDTR